MTTPDILIVEDDAILITHLEHMLIQSGYRVSGRAATGETAVELALAQKPDAILMDISLRSAMTGIQAAAEIHRQLDTPIIYLTSYTDEETLQQAKLTDAYAYLAKPVRDRELRASLEMALFKHATEQRLNHLNQILRATRDVNHLIAHEHDPQRLLDQACQILLRANGYQFVWIGQSTGDRLKALAHAGEGQTLLTSIITSATPEQGTQLPGTQAARTRRLVVCHDMLQDERYAPWRDEVEQVHFASTVAVPILHEESLFGVLSVYSDQTNIFGEEELDLLLELTADIAFGLKAIDREVERKWAEDALRESEARFRMLLQDVQSVSVQGYRMDGTTQYWNKASENLYGYAAHEAIGKNLLDLIIPVEMKEGVTEAIAYMVESGQPIPPAELSLVKKDGSRVVVYSSHVIVKRSGGEPELFCIDIDLSAHKQAEAEIARMALALDVAPSAVTIYDFEGHFLYANQRCLDLHGYTRDEFMSLKLCDLEVPISADLIASKLQELVEHGEATLQEQHYKKNGTLLPLEVEVRLTSWGDVRAILSMATDISDRLLAEAALRESENRLKQAQRIAQIGNWELDLGKNSLIWSDEIYRIFEIDPAKFGATYDAFLEAIHPEDREAVDLAYTSSLKTRSAYEIDHRLLMPDGRVKSVHERCENFFDGDGLPLRSVGTVQDITERQKVEQAIRESEQRFSTIFHASPIPILIVRLVDAQFVDVNEAFQSLSGYTRQEVIGHTALDLNQWVNPDEFFRMELLMRQQGSIHDFETQLRSKSGQIHDTLISAALIEVSGERYVVNLAFDITSRKQHEIELHSIARLSAALRTAPSRLEMLPVIVEQLVILLNCETVSIEIIDPLSGDAVIEAAHGIWAELMGTHQKKGTGINAIISQTLQPYSTNDLRSDPNLAYPEWAREDIRGCIGAPLLAQDQLIGFMWMGRRSEIVESDVRLFTAVADIAANAIHRSTLHEQSQRDAAELVLAYDSTLEGWAHALELRDQETEGHTRRVTQMTVELAKAMGVDKSELENVRRGALLHDIGKMGIPDSVLLKPGTLNEREWEIMRRHPEYAYQFLASIDYLRPVLDIPYCHHEKWDGSGYPRELKGEQIPFVARIFAVVDVWDALRSDRPYRKAWPQEKARQYILEQSGAQFDPQVVTVFMDLLERP